MKFNLSFQRGNKFPMCASYYDNVLFIGDSRNYIHWIDCSNGMFDILKVYFNLFLVFMFSLII